MTRRTRMMVLVVEHEDTFPTARPGVVDTTADEPESSSRIRAQVPTDMLPPAYRALAAWVRK